MKIDPRLREQMDACRGTGDLGLPELAELAESVGRDAALARELSGRQRLDELVVRALRAGPVPDGLEERLLAAVEAADRFEAGPKLPTIKPVGGSWWQRKLTVRQLGYASAAAALLVVIAASGAHYWHRSRQLLEQEQIASALEGWQKAAKSNRPTGGLPSDFVLPPLPIKPVRYVPFKTEEGWSAVAVDCTTPVGSPATLFIVFSRTRFGGGDLPLTQLAASGKKVAAWRKGDVLYVLVEEVAKPRTGASIRYGAAPPA